MAAPGWYPDPSNAPYLRWWNGSTWTSDVAPAQASVEPCARVPEPAQSAPQSVATAGGLEQTVSELQRAIAQLSAQKEVLEAQLVETSELYLLQEVGIYRYSHPLDSSAAYKDALQRLNEELRAFVKGGQAVTGTKKWAINGSEKDGAKMVADFCKLMLRAYNNEADNAVRALKPHSLGAAVERLQNTRSTISRLGVTMHIEVTDVFHALRVKELELTADYLAKLAAEKEQEREARVRLKEEEVARREYEREQARLEKERTHYETALNALRMQGDTAAIAATEQKIAEIQDAIEGVAARSANVRAGYVYVISNIGSFGDGVVKIGMTRRIQPMDRVTELGDASVPFRFDVHALFFSDDAVGIENALHQRFASRRVNLINAHREFFFTTPAEVKAALLELQGNLLTFVDMPEALEWRQSQRTRSTDDCP